MLMDLTNFEALLSPKLPHTSAVQDRCPVQTRTWKDYLLSDTAILVWMAVALISLLKTADACWWLLIG